jgi:putative acetyltransferase
MLNIRQPELSEYPLLLDLWEASVRATHHFLNEDDIVFYRSLISKNLPMLDLYCFCDNDGAILGFIALNDNMVQALFIHPLARRRGIGKQLMRFAISHKQITLVDVNEQNEDALSFYRSFGFKAVSRSELDGAGRPYPLLSLSL